MRSALLVVAHPDDEALFFSPTILALRGKLHVLCLSTGNAYEQGETRRKEFVRSCEALHVAPDKCLVLDAFVDGPQNIWSPSAVADIVAFHLRRTKATHLITFDQNGVSSHPNHVAVFRGVEFLIHRQKNDVSALKLHSYSMLLRFTGPLALVPALLLCFGVGLLRSLCIYMPHLSTCLPLRSMPSSCALCLTPWACHRAMREHASQYVWYRRLHVVFASLTYCNLLLRV